MNESELKKEFAKLSLSEDDPFKIALKLFPKNTNLALQTAYEWPSDPEVIAAKEDLLASEDGTSFLPTKAALAKKIWEKMHPEGGRIDPDDYAKLVKVYADIRGFIEKPQTNINNAPVTVNKVMVIKEKGSDDDWETKLKAQQAKLQNKPEVEAIEVQAQNVGSVWK